MRVLKLASGVADIINSFLVNVGSDVPKKCVLMQGYSHKDDCVYWALGWLNFYPTIYFTDCEKTEV